MRKWIFTVAVALLGMSVASANGPFSTVKSRHMGDSRPVLPVFQAAPWYLYWPYDAHFQTPAPIYGAFYGPGGQNTYGQMYGQPYFPASPMNQYPGTPMQVGPRP
jgi:hypothetical protein